MRNSDRLGLLALAVLAAVIGAALPAHAVGNCGVYKTFVAEVLTPSDLNNSLLQAATTNSTPQCVDDYSATATQMGATTDPYPGGSVSLATSLAGELERLRYQIAQIHGQANWYSDPTPLTPPGDLQLGVASSRSGLAIFYHASSAFRTTVQAANATAAADYTWPAAPPTISGAPLTATTAGVMSWTSPLPIATGGTNSTTALNNNRLMVSSSGTIAEAGAMTNGQLLIGSTAAAPVVAALTAGSNITITNGAGSITIAGSGGLSRAGGNTTEATTTSTTDVDLITVSGLSISAATPVMIVASLKRSAGAAAASSVGLKVNATVVRTPQSFTDSTNEAKYGTAIWIISPRTADYAGCLQIAGSAASGGGINSSGQTTFCSDVPSVTITDIIIRANAGNAALTMGVDEVHVYTLPTS